MQMEIVHKFSDSASAWRFMAQCAMAHAVAGYPSLGPAPYTVRTINVITAAQVRAVIANPRGDQSLIDACHDTLWASDAHGIITQRTESTDRVRAVIVARMDAGEL